MSEYDMTGLISRNDYKEQDKHPDYKGKCEIGGKEYLIAAWIRERKDGSGKFLSMKFEEAESKQAQSKSKSSSEEVPF
jgi:uncharacterized protein (DUF736 family)